MSRSRPNRRLQIAVLASVLIHGAVLYIIWPETSEAGLRDLTQDRSDVMVVWDVPPPPRPTQPPRSPDRPVVRRDRVRVVPTLDPEAPEEDTGFVFELDDAPPIEWDQDSVLVFDPSMAPAAPAAPDPGRTYRPGGDVRFPRLLRGVDPIYPELAKRINVQGVVQIEATISPEGEVINARVIRGLPAGCDQAALDAVRRWRYAPATLNGTPVAVYLVVNVAFELT